MPDPQLGNGGLTFQAHSGSGKPSGSSGGPTRLGANPDSPQFKTADKACHQFLGAVEGPSTQEEQG
jgi:hypothetical protein